MPTNNLKGTVLNAAKVPLLRQVTVRGNNAYTFGSNLVSWDESNSYMMTTVADTFGQAVKDNDQYPMGFRCGDATISVYDFGLLYSCFVGMMAAYIETGSNVATLNDDTTEPSIHVVWFGNHGIVYSASNNLIVPLKSADIQKACRYDNIQVDNFNDTRRFHLQREGLFLCLAMSSGEWLCKFRVPVTVQRTYPQLFKDAPNPQGEAVESKWDTNSQLGNLVNGSLCMTDAEDTVRQYRERPVLDNIVVRDDLIFKPSERYASTQELFGSICYTDKGAIALAVNFRNNLFVYQPYFNGAQKVTGVQVDPAPQFGNFYNVTEECKTIVRYANNVTVLPLTAAQFDAEVFERVRNAFFQMSLPRIQFASTFGKIVIPEPVLLNGLASASGETAYCIVPVGAIGGTVICKEADGSLNTVKVSSGQNDNSELWGFDTAFYDITGVI